MYPRQLFVTSLACVALAACASSAESLDAEPSANAAEALIVGADAPVSALPIAALTRDVRRMRGLHVPHSLSTPPARLALELFDGETLRMEQTRVTRKGQDSFVWFGSTKDGSAVRLRMEHGRLSGHVTHRGRVFLIESGTDGGSVLMEVSPADRGCASTEDVSEAPVIAETTPSGGSAGGASTSGSSAASTSNTKLRIYVVYTNDARAAAGSTSNMLSQIDDFLDDTNEAFENGGVPVTVELAGSMEVSLNEGFSDKPSDFADWLHDRMKDDTKQIAQNRKATKADVVALIVENLPDACGTAITIGPSMYKAGFVADRGCSRTQFSFTHELGHLFGARHDWRVDWTPGSAHGYADTDNNFRTMMAYDNECVAKGVTCPRIRYFSSPDHSYNGHALGGTLSNNVSKLKSTYSTLSSYGEAL